MYTVRIFMNCTQQLIYSIEPDFPCLADETAEPRPDMNIKVAAFTVSKKSSNTCQIKLYIFVAKTSACECELLT